LPFGRPFVIENVDGARRDLEAPFMLCGSSFGLAVRRHRWFECSVWITPRECSHRRDDVVVGVYGDHPDRRGAYHRPNGGTRGVKARSVDEARAAMGMPFASWQGLTQAIPPAFTDWIGSQIMSVLNYDTRIRVDSEGALSKVSSEGLTQ
jgi:DNA (cytosine-5)-methyltransferase 1